MRFINFVKKYWSKVYGAVLISYTILVLLITFVVPSAIETDTSGAGVYAVIDTEEKSSENKVIVTDTAYADENVQINLKTDRIEDTDIYFADIVLKDIKYLKTAFAEDTYGRNINECTSEIAKEHNAILAINGDFYGFRDYGVVIRNGVLYRSNFNRETDPVFVVYEDGSCDTVQAGQTETENLLENGVVQAISFGPALVEDGIVTVAESDPYDTQTIAGRNPRTAIGMITPLHYVFVVADGRSKESQGYTFYELAKILADYGCKEAYNLDGGGSSTMYFNGVLVNKPTDGTSVGERVVSDIVYIGYR